MPLGFEAVEHLRLAKRLQRGFRVLLRRTRVCGTDQIMAQRHLNLAAKSISQAVKSGTVGQAAIGRFAWSDQLELLLLQRELKNALNNRPQPSGR